MRICLISEYFYPDNAGGTGAVLSNLARYLQDEYSDLQLDVITSRNLYRGEADSLPLYENWGGINICRLQTPKSNRPSAALRLAAGTLFTAAAFRKLALRQRYDLLFVVTSPPMLPMAARAFRRLRRTPYVYLIHDLYPNVATALGVLSPESTVGRFFGRLQRGWLCVAHKNIVLGSCMRDYLAQHYAVPKEKVEVITNWADDKEILPLPKTTRFRKEHQITGKVVLYAGNFGKYQNFDNILDAAKLLLKTPSHAPGSAEQISFVLVGDGARKEHIAKRIKEENISNIRLFPFVDRADLGDLLASADVSLVTLEPGMEGLGVPSKFYNILASGRPTVAIVGAQSEVANVLQEADCGLRVEQGEPEQLAGTLAQLLASPEALERLGKNARAVFEQKYTLQHISRQFYNVFEATTNAPPKPLFAKPERANADSLTSPMTK